MQQFHITYIQPHWLSNISRAPSLFLILYFAVHNCSDLSSDPYYQPALSLGLSVDDFFSKQFSSRLHLPLHNFTMLSRTAEYNYVFFQDYKCLWKRAGSAQYSITYGVFVKLVVFKCMHGWKISIQTLTWNMCARLRYFIMLVSFTLHVLTFEFWAYYILFIFDFKMDTPR